jgi:hypothetical protein
MHALASQHRFRLLLVFLPGRSREPIDTQHLEWLRRYGEQRDLPLLDLSDPIEAAGRAAFIPDNPHYNLQGHRIVADHLATFLDKHLPTLPSSPTARRK